MFNLIQIRLNELHISIYRDKNPNHLFKESRQELIL